MHQPYPVPSDDEAQLVALESLEIIGSSRTAAFDAVLALALTITGCPVGAIGIMGGEFHWLKATRGLDLQGVPRKDLLCNYTLLQSEPLIVENLTQDARFAEHLFVREHGARFYAGIAVGAEGCPKVGTLCLVDDKPRLTTSDLEETLRSLGRVTDGLIEAHNQTSKAEALARLADRNARAIWRKTRLVAQTERVAKIGAWTYDIATNSLEMSDECYRIYDLTPGDPVELATLRLLRTPPFRARAQELYETMIETGESYDLTGEVVTITGRHRWVQLIAEAEQKDGKVVRMFGTTRDVTSEHEAERVLWRAAHYDALTGAPNRYHWTLKFARAFEEASRSSFPLSILIFDLDGFKEINDTSGHPTGDMVLREIAARIAANLPSDSFHARLGGDEFAVLLFGPFATAAVEKTAHAVVEAMRKPIVTGETSLQVSGTFGGATYPKDGETADELMKNADIALYQAKRSRRGSFLPFRPETGAVFDEKRRAIEIVASALDAGRLVPFYQPKVDLRTGRCIGFEALCRIEAADGTIAGPKQFHSALEDATIVSRICVAMLDRVTADIAGWYRGGIDPGRIALNVATADFIGGGLADRTLRRLKAMGLPPSALEIEIVENTLIGEDSGTVLSELARLVGEGIMVSLDDFGTGYASLTPLRDTPIRCIKIDRSFVAGLGGPSDSAIIVRSLVELGHDLKLSIVAEGVETEGQAKFLRDIGCDIAQGFLFGRPASQVATTAILMRRDVWSPIEKALAG